MKKRIFTVLCAVLVLVLAGCGEKTEPLVGSWTCELDMTEAVREAFSADESTAEYLTIPEFKLLVNLEFREDQTFSKAVDEAALDAAVDSLLDSFTDGISRYMEELVLEEKKREMTIDEILDEIGMTMDELTVLMFPEETMEALKEELIAGMAQEGKYKSEEGKLYMSAGLEYEVDPEVYEVYTLEGNILTLLEHVGSDAEENTLYPMEFHKVN